MGKTTQGVGSEEFVFHLKVGSRFSFGFRLEFARRQLETDQTDQTKLATRVCVGLFAVAVAIAQAPVHRVGEI